MIKMRKVILLLAAMAAAMLVAVGAALAIEQPPTFIAKWGSEGTGDGQFLRPQGVATDAQGNVYVTDGCTPANVCSLRVQKFDSNGTFKTQWGGPGFDDGQFGGTGGIAVDSSSGNVYVVDSGGMRIQKFDSNGTFLTKWSVNTNQVHDVAVDSSGNVYVSNGSFNRIQKFDPNGSFITSWGGFGTSNGMFSGIRAVATDAQDNVYVTDSSRVQKFDSNGTFLTKWGSQGTNDGQFQNPNALATDSSGHVYVSDSSNNRIQKFDSKGTFLAKWGSAGTGDGQFQFPFGIDTDSSGNVFVADSSNNRIQKFSPAPSSVPPKPTTPILDPASDSGVSSTDNITNDDTPTLTGEAEKDSTVKVYDGDTADKRTLLGEITADASGKWSFTVGGSGSASAEGVNTLSQGKHTITATASNGSGESDPSDALQITIDTQAPSVNTVSPENNKTGVPSSTTVSVKFLETGSGIDGKSVTNDTFKLEQVKPTGNVKVSGQVGCESTSACENPTFTPDESLPKGAYRATITTGVTDKAGNALENNYPWSFTTVGPRK